MLVDGRQRVQSKFRRARRQPRLVRAGQRPGGAARARYEIRLARGRPCRESLACAPVPSPFASASSSFSRDRIQVGAGKRFSVRVRTDARVVSLALRRRRGVGAAARFSSFARPEEPGSYTLYVTVGGRGAERPRRRHRSPSDASPLDPARRQPLGHDAPARHPRSLAGLADPRRVVLRPAARAPPRQDDRRRALPRRRLTDPDDPRLGRLDRGRRARASARNAHAARRSPRSTRRTRTRPASRAGATRRRCTCGTSRCSSELFPDAQYVHLIRDGRDAALSFLQMPEGTFTRTWAHPRDARAVRVPVAEGGRRRARARPPRRRRALPRGALRGARRGSRGGRSRDLRVRGDPVRADDARLHRRGRRLREAAPAAAPARLRRPACGAGARTCRGRRGRVRRRRGRPSRPSSATSARPTTAVGRTRSGSRVALVRRAPHRAWNVAASAAPALAALASPSSAALSLRCFGASDRAYAMSRPFSDRKYVRSVAIPGVYLPSGSARRSIRRRPAQRVRAASRASRRTRTAPITTGAPRSRPPTDVLQSSSPARRAERAQAAVESAGEDAALCDGRRRVPEPADAARPHDAAAGGVERDDLSRARDRVERSPSDDGLA